MFFFSLGLIVLGFTPAETSLEEKLQPLGHWNAGKYLKVVQEDDGPLLALFENGLDVFQTQIDEPMVRLGRLHLGYQRPSAVLALPQSAAILTDRALVLVDLTDPSQPQIASQLPIQASAMAFQGTSLFLLGETTYTVDIADLHQPQITHQFELGFAPVAGYLLDQFLITLTRQTGAQVFAIDSENQTLLAVAPPTGALTGPVVDAVLTGRILYLAADGIYGFEITDEGVLNPHTTLATNLAIRDLEMFGDILIWAGNEGEFDGLEYAKLDAEFRLNGPPSRLNKGGFNAIHASSASVFFGISQQTGIHQFRPETSFSNVDTAAHQKPAIAAAFDNPFVYLAHQDELQVLNFQDPNNPVTVATYPGLPANIQTMTLADGWLHLAGGNDYHRYLVASTGQLTLENSLSLPETITNEWVLTIYAAGDEVWVGRTGSVTHLRFAQGPELLGNFDLRASHMDHMVISPPLVTFTYPGAAHTFAMTPPDQLESLGSINLFFGEGVVKDPLTIHSGLLIAGNQVFDIRQRNLPRELRSGPYLFEDAFIDDDFLAGIGENGLEIWDFADPNSPVLLLNQPFNTGESLLQSGDLLLTFQSQPTVLTLFSKPDFSSDALIPWMVDNFEFKSQVGFFNGSERSVTLHLSATNRFGVTVERDLALPAESARTYDASQLFPGRTGYSLSIRGPRSVWVTYININVEPQSGGDSPSQTTSMRVDDLGDRMAFNVTGPPATAAITLVSPDDGDSIPVVLSLADDQGVVAEASVTLKSQQPLPLLIAELFPETFKENGVIIAKTQNGERIAGTAFTYNQSRQPAMGQPFTVDKASLNPVRFTPGERYGDAQSFRAISFDNGVFVQAGASGVVTRGIANPQEPIVAYTPINGVLDAVQVDDTLLVLTKWGLEVRDANSGELLRTLPLERDVDRLKVSGGFLFQFRLRLGSIAVFDLDNPRDPVPAGLISTGFKITIDVIYHNDQVFVLSSGGIDTYQRSVTGSFDFLGYVSTGSSMRRFFMDQGTLLLPSDNRIRAYHPRPGQVPSFGAFYNIDGRLESVNGGRGLILNQPETVATLVNLEDMSELGVWELPSDFRVTDVRLWGDFAWFRSVSNRLALVSFADTAQPEPISDFGLETRIANLTRTASALYATEIRDRRSIFHILEDDSDPSRVGAYDLGPGQPKALRVRDGLAFIAYQGGGLVIVDLHEAQPKVVAKVGQTAENIILDGPFAIISGGDYLAEIYDVSDPENPIEIGNYPARHLPTSLAADGSLILATEQGFGLRILDSNTPAEPTEIGALATSANKLNGSTYDVTFKEGFAYLAEHDGLGIVDYSDPQNPREIGRMLQDPTISFRKVAILGDVLFVVGYGRLALFDISDPGSPKLLEILDNVYFTDMAVSENFLWFSNGYQVQKYEWQPQTAVLPWAVQNDRFGSQIQLANLSDGPEAVRLNAVDTNGQAQVQTVVLSPNSAQTLSPVDLFPQLGSAAITVETQSNKIAASFNTFSLNSGGELGAPAQAGGLPSANLRDGIAFSFPNPIETAALVIAAPLNQGPKTIHLDLFGPNGWVARSQLTLQDQRPTGKTLAELFTDVDLPGSITVTAQSEDGTRLTGTTFIFNQRRQPATSEAFSRSAIFMPGSPSSDVTSQGK